MILNLHMKRLYFSCKSLKNVLFYTINCATIKSISGEAQSHKYCFPQLFWWNRKLKAIILVFQASLYFLYVMSMTNLNDWHNCAFLCVPFMSHMVSYWSKVTDSVWPSRADLYHDQITEESLGYFSYLKIAHSNMELDDFQDFK